MDKDMIRLRVDRLREWMRNVAEVEAYVVTSADEHDSEYVAPRWRCREWLSGFTGSAGTIVVTVDEALLWTDSRYFLQAATQLEGTGIVLMREGTEGVVDWPVWLSQNLDASEHVGFLPDTFTMAQFRQIENQADCTLTAVEDDPFDEIWTDRPAAPCEPVTLWPEERAGRTVAQKMANIWGALESQQLDYYLLTDLSEIAWTLNLRGNDVENTPLFIAYLLLRADHTGVLYVDLNKISMQVAAFLAHYKWDVLPYDTWRHEISPRGPGRLGMSPNASVAAHYMALSGQTERVELPSPVPFIRMIKTKSEQEGFRRAMERDGVAMVRFLRWLGEHLADGVTEIEVDKRLTAFRAEMEHFRSRSFDTIAAYGPHAAIVHYEATPATDVRLEARGLLLLDSGAQYEDGTTDITRTVALGPTTAEEREAYTLVLKAHIGLAEACFPDGTSGLELDYAARRPLWQCGYDFGHGTGHGVGSFLCVHEGPVQIRKNVRLDTLSGLSAGNVITNEPGVYVAGKFGVRIENVLLGVPAMHTDFGDFCRFETLTLCPIDLSPVVFDWLTPAEQQWLDAYHAEVRARLLPLLADEADCSWLVEHTAPVAEQRPVVEAHREA